MAANNKVIYGNDTIMDISDSTTSSNNLLNGAIGYSGTGDRVVGSLIPATPDDLDKAELSIWNLVRTPYTSEGGQLSTGITATINSDGSVTFNGTSSGDTTFWFKGDGDSIYLPKRTSDYLFKCCPDGGSVNTYCANVLVYSGGSFVPIAINTNHQGIHVSTRNADREVYVNAVIKDGTTVSDLTFNAPSILPIVPADGHVISNDSGAGLQQRRKLKFKGVYTKDTNSVDDITEVDIVREFNSVSNIEALTGEEAKGFQYLDDDVYDEFTAGDIGFDNSDTSFVGTNVQDVLEEVDDKIDGVSVLKINANTYSTWGQALSALGTAWSNLTQAQKERSYLLWDGRLRYNLQDMTDSNRVFTCTICGGSSLVVRSMYIASKPYYLVATIGTSTSIVNNTSSAQAESIELKY